MHLYLPVLIGLLAVLAAAGLAGRWVRLPAPILLAAGGALLAVIPGLPRVPLHPDLILLLFLPPLLYADAFHTSWIDFRRWLRPILLLAVGLVAATILVVGVTVHALLPGLPWPACFILGAVVSPTDTVAVQSVLDRLRIPRRATAILGGESLVNDATGLVGVQLGVAVALSGTFTAGAVALEFARVAGGGVVIGLAVGALFAAANRAVRQVQVLFLLSLLSPYLAFALAHSLHTSGVLAVVVAGFVVAWRIHRVPAEARVKLYFTWDLLAYVLNGLCFVFIGWETPNVIRATALGGDRSLLLAGLGVTAAVIVCRIVWVFPTAYLTLWLSPRLREREGGYPPWSGVALVSWCGMRGVISLAAALALPESLDAEAPGTRSAIIGCALCVILGTLLVQGTTLLPLVRLLGIREDEDGEAEVHTARAALLVAGIARLDEFCSEKSCPLAVHHWRTSMEDALISLRHEDAEERKRARSRLSVSAEVRTAVAAAQSAELLARRDRGEINDKTYLALQLELDRATYELTARDGHG